MDGRTDRRMERERERDPNHVTIDTHATTLPAPRAGDPDAVLSNFFCFFWVFFDFFGFFQIFFAIFWNFSPFSHQNSHCVICYGSVIVFSARSANGHLSNSAQNFPSCPVLSARCRSEPVPQLRGDPAPRTRSARMRSPPAAQQGAAADGRTRGDFGPWYAVGRNPGISARLRGRGRSCAPVR